MTAIQGKIACISGGLGGIGFEIAKALLRNGLKGLVIADIDDNKAKSSIKHLEDIGDGQVYFRKTDLFSRDQAECVLKTTVATFGNIDIIINNFGVIDEEDYERMIQINYINTLYVTLLALFKYFPKHKGDKHGCVINTSSVFGLTPLSSLPVYSACSNAIIAIGRTFGTDFYFNRTFGKVLTLCPGLTKTSFIDREKLKAVDLQLCDKEFEGLQIQGPCDCAMCVLKMLNEGQNGSVWISEATECYQYPFRDRFLVRKDMQRTGKCADLLKKKKETKKK